MTFMKFVTSATIVGATAMLVLGGASGSATAASANISAWNSQASCNFNSNYVFCLYYSPNQSGGVDARVWDAAHETNNKVSNISGTFSGGAGNGQPAFNNAASVDSGVNCNVAVWSGTGFQGNSDWLSPGKGGNLGPALRNHDESIAVDDSTRCHGIGIG
jgi:hypothetical protein